MLKATVKKMRMEIANQIKDENENSTVYMCACQIAEIVGNDEAAAQLVLDDFASGHSVKGCEAEIKKWVDNNHKGHSGGCSADKAAEIICKYFGIRKSMVKPNPFALDEEPVTKVKGNIIDLSDFL